MPKLIVTSLPKKQAGFTLVEIVVSVAIFAIIVTAFLNIFTVITRNVKVARENVVVAGIANQFMEIAKNLSYSQIGTLISNPTGTLPNQNNPQTVTVGSNTYNIYYDVRYMDDPADGLVGTDAYPNDYKQIRIYIANAATNKTYSFVTNIAPKGLESASSSSGSLKILVLNAQGSPISGASVQITYPTTTPIINVTRTTDSSGQVLEYGLPSAVNSYHIVASLSGYLSDQTNPITSQNPNPTNPDTTVQNGIVTQVTLVIDQPANLTLKTLDTICQAVPNTQVNISGAYLIGNSPNVLNYNQTFTSNSSGNISLNNLHWDTYTPVLTTGNGNSVIKGTSPVQKIDVLPSTSQVFTMILTNNTTPNSLLVVVKDASTGVPLEGADVTLTRILQAPPGWVDKDWNYRKIITVDHTKVEVTNSVTIPFTTLGLSNWTVPANVSSITVKAWGAGGGGAGDYAYIYNTRSGAGGGGGFAQSTFSVSTGDAIKIYVGGGGGNGIAYGGAGGGGGYSSVWKNSNLVLVAGGGGGGGGNYYQYDGGNGGVGGGSSGGSGGSCSSCTGGSGGSQSSVGSGGSGNNCSGVAGLGSSGGNGCSYNGLSNNGGAYGGGLGSNFYGGSGGGGGGYFGGGGGGSSANLGGGAGGGGGSSLGPTLISGSGVNPGASTDSLYLPGAGVGGARAATGSSAAGSAGGNGYVVISYTLNVSSLNGFPMLVSVQDTNLKSSSNGGNMGRSDGLDLIFTSSDGTTKLYYDLEYYDAQYGRVIAWVRIPQLSAITDTQIYMYFGNSLATDQSNKTATWDNNFQAVWHLSSSSGFSSNDSTINANNATNNGVSATNGKFNSGGGSLNGTSAYLALPSAPFGNYTSANYNLTFETWFKSGYSGTILGQNDNYTPPSVPVSFVPAVYLDSSGKIRTSMFWHGSNSSQLSSSGGYADNNWHHLVNIYSNGKEFLYLDGNLVTSQNFSQVSYGVTNKYFLGTQYSNGWANTSNNWFYFKGILDETRISNIARGSDWIQTEYNNQNSPWNFYAVGNLEQQPTSGATVQTFTGTTGGSVWVQNDWSGGSGSSNWSNSLSNKYFQDNAAVDVSSPGSVKLLKTGSTYMTSGVLESASFDTGTTSTNFTILNWQPTSQSANTSVKFQIAANKDNATWNYVGPDGTASSYFTTPGTDIGSSLDNNQYVRYKVFLQTTDNTITPTLTSVSINYVSGCYTPGQTFFGNLDAVIYNLSVSKSGYVSQNNTLLNVNGNQSFQVLMTH